MPPFRLPSLTFAAAALALGACSIEDGYGYGGLSVGYGSAGYCDPYWDDCYGGYGHAYPPYFGWYDDYYYPGIGIYIYDRGGRRHAWDDHHRRYWEGRRERWGNRELRENWREFRQDRREDRREFRAERREDRRALREGQVTREQFRQDRREDRREFRRERREDRRELRRENRRDRRD